MATLNRALSILWTGDLWLSRQDADLAGRLGLYFLRAYIRLGEIAYQERRPRWPIYPKHHLVFHQFYYLASSAARLEYVFNNVCEACAMDEDFVGRFCRVTRRSGTRGIIRASLRKYLVCCRTVWHHELY